MNTAQGETGLTTRGAVAWIVGGLGILILGTFMPEVKIVPWGGTWKELVQNVGGFMALGGTYWTIKIIRARRRSSQQAVGGDNSPARRGRVAPQLQRWSQRGINRLAIVALAAWLTGCSTSAPDPGVVHDINGQIAKFNSERIPDMGVTPITARVARVQLADAAKEMTCLDQSGNTVVVLKRQPDGSFAGQMRTPYHQLPNPERHSWGEAILDIRVEKERLQPGVGR